MWFLPLCFSLCIDFICPCSRRASSQMPLDLQSGVSVLGPMLQGTPCFEVTSVKFSKSSLMPGTSWSHWFHLYELWLLFLPFRAFSDSLSPMQVDQLFKELQDPH